MCRGYLERTVWDGSQTLYEIRTAAHDTTWDYYNDAPVTQTSSAYQYMLGRVAYVHGSGIDEPLGVYRMGMPGQNEGVGVAPHTNGLGDFYLGSMIRGSYHGQTNQECTEGYNGCPLIRWPGDNVSADGAPSPASQMSTWYGNLLNQRSDGSGLQYLRNRYYDARTGRFTQQDPIGLAGGLNLYGFASGDPVNFSDPFGLCPDGVRALAARGGPRYTVLVDCEDASQDVRSGGTRAWRNNNPGNMEAGSRSRSYGSIGAAGGASNARFAVFPDEATGQAALVSLLQTGRYQSQTVANAIATWAPPRENNTQAYQAAVEKATGIAGGTLMSSLTSAKLHSVAGAIRRHEGWREGTVVNHRPVRQ